MRRRGFSLVEMLVALAILSVFVFIIIGLERGTLALVRDSEVRQTTLTDLDPVLARFGRDVHDAAGYWPNGRALGPYRQSESTLILRLPPDSEGDAVVWDFTDSRVQRIVFEGNTEGTTWVWNGPAAWNISAYRGRWVRLQASIDGRALVDRIWRPRAG